VKSGQLFAAIAGALVAVEAARGQAAIQLTAAQRATLDRGELVVVTQARQASAWPAVTVYAFVDATPEEAAAVFTDYEQHKAFIPSLGRSHVARTIDAATAEVEYVLRLPLVSDEEYTVRDHLSADGGTYLVDWTLVRASSVKGTIGHARFLPYMNARTGTSGTLLEYFNFVTPGSRLAGLGYIRNRSIRQVQETVRAVVKRVESVRAQPGHVHHRVAALRAALGSREK
jgi:hypothetical protein